MVGACWPRSREAGRAIAAEATEPLNKMQFGLGVLDEAEAGADQRRRCGGCARRAGDLAEDIPTVVVGGSFDVQVNWRR